MMAKNRALHFTEKQIDAQAVPDDASIERANELATPLLRELLNAEPTE